MKIELSNTKIALGRPFTSYTKVQWLISSIIRNKSFFANSKEPGCYLDLGCGPNVNPDFCNLDYRWRPGVDICWDVTKGLPIPNEYFGGIFTEHMLEHIPFANTLALLAECKRVLRKGSTLRIVVPDGELYLSEYAKHISGNAAKMPYADGDKDSFAFVTPLVSINRIFREHGHQFIWDYETLRAALRQAGFENIEKFAFGEGGDAKLLRDTPSRRVESLYVEAK